jgi:hypothetical protein
MADIVLSQQLQRGKAGLTSRALDPAHFEFRQGAGKDSSGSPLRRRVGDRLKLEGG